MIKSVAAICLLSISFTASALPPEGLIGTWKLESKKCEKAWALAKGFDGKGVVEKTTFYADGTLISEARGKTDIATVKGKYNASPLGVLKSAISQMEKNGVVTPVKTQNSSQFDVKGKQLTITSLSVMEGGPCPVGDKTISIFVRQ